MKEQGGVDWKSLMFSFIHWWFHRHSCASRKKKTSIKHFLTETSSFLRRWSGG